MLSSSPSDGFDLIRAGVHPRTAFAVLRALFRGTLPSSGAASDGLTSTRQISYLQPINYVFQNSIRSRTRTRKFSSDRAALIEIGG
jgi:hypothetical protein